MLFSFNTDSSDTTWDGTSNTFSIELGAWYDELMESIEALLPPVLFTHTYRSLLSPRQRLTAPLKSAPRRHLRTVWARAPPVSVAYVEAPDDLR